VWEAIHCLGQLFEPLKAVNAHAGIAGSVASRGTSTKDLDLVVFPWDASKPFDVESIRRVFVNEMQWTLVMTKDEVHAIWREKGSSDTKHVEVWQTKTLHRRIDVFFLQGG
jgi:hypothetical protein